MEWRLLDPRRNETPRLWQRLRGASALPIIFVAAVLIGSLSLDGAEGIERKVFIGILLALVVLAFVSSRSQQKLVDELRNRYDDGSNKPSESTR